MKSVLNVLFLSLILLVTCSCSRNSDTSDRALQQMLATKDYFSLVQALPHARKYLAKERWLYYQMYCDQFSGKDAQSNDCADQLLSKYRQKLNDTLLADVMAAKAMNYSRMYRYKEAAVLYDAVLDQYVHVLDSASFESYQNVYLLVNTLASVKPQTMSMTGDVEIAAYRNRMNHLMTPVESGGSSDEFIFDTGANISTVSEHCANKMGFSRFAVTIDMGTSTHVKIRSQLAVADSLYVGDILFENVVFLVVPDSLLTFPSVDYSIHGIIGFPVIFQMGEICFRKEGPIVILQSPRKTTLHNMFLDDFNPVVQLLTETDTLLFTLDTGARNSELSGKFYDHHRAMVEKEGEKRRSPRGGAGAIVDVDEYLLSGFHYTIGNKSHVLNEIPVICSEYDFNKCYDGNLGQDVFLQFDEMILNFQEMFLDFK